MLEQFFGRDGQAVDALPSALVTATSPVVTARYADRGLIFSDNSFYRAALLGDVEVSQTAFDALGMGGRIALTAAEVALWNGDRGLDLIASRGLANGRTLKLRTVSATQPWRSDAGGDLAAASDAFIGVVGGLTPDGQQMRVSAADWGWRLNTPLQTTLYGGTGGLDGGSDLQGKPKPICLGYCFNIQPVYLGLADLGDGAKQTYQSHWRPMKGHLAVRERGVAMTQTVASPGVGQWRDWPALGVFQLGFTPDGVITCDAQGDTSPFYAGTTEQVIERLLTTLGPVLSAADLDLGSIGLIGTQLVGEIGWYQGAAAITAADALDDLVTQAGIWAVGNRKGQLRLALPQPLAGVENLLLDLGDIVSLAPTALPTSLSPAPAAVEVLAQKNWAPLTDISSGVSADDRSALAGQGRIVRITSDLIGGRQAQSKTMSLPGLFRQDVDAQRRGQALLTWLEKGLRAFTVTTDKYLGQVELGHVARVTYPLFGLSNGFTGVVAAWSETINKRRLTMTLVG